MHRLLLEVSASGPGHERALRAMVEMEKLDVAALEGAFEGETAT